MKNKYLISFLWMAILLSHSFVLCAQQGNEITVTRKFLLENFTTEKCANCPRGHATLEKVFGDREDVIWVCHHSGYYKDDYTTEYGEAYLWLYGQTPFAPGVMIDRTRFIKQNNWPGPVVDVTEEIAEGLLDASTAVPALVSIEIYGEYDSENRWLQVMVKGEKTVEELPDGKDVRLNIFLTEDSIKSTTQVSSPTPVYIHNNVMRTSMTGTWGIKANFVNKRFTSDPFLVKIEKDWEVENMSVVAFFSNYDRKDYNKCIVYNAETAKIEGLPSSLPTVEKQNINLLVTEEAIVVTGDENCSFFYLFDLTGKMVRSSKNENCLDISGIKKGIYLAECLINGSKYIKKIFL